ncbi:hypothetical protein EPZ47_18815 [Pseudomonas viciae]|uniref:Uncharacterized protein n=1 Tax=Pseudomonas viciae TaxID=2505979 RepID=A0A4P7PIV6_9PSED|nr:hypothetical protein [Pseudomonas viciae]QBZ90679.1 hypothetical protein EPZ47_18815 [Pseudomonas viciae]
MPMPEELKDAKTNHSIFLYCETLRANCNDLAQILKEKNYWEIWEQEDITQAQKYRAPTVWLVGHGDSKKSGMLNDNGDIVTSMENIIFWCNTNGVTNLVDTACYPSARINAIETHKEKLSFNYYCKSTEAEVSSIGKYIVDGKNKSIGDLEKWWNSESFTLKAKKSV